MATLILTVIGDDRPGLVSAISAPVEAHGGSWERSELSRLEGKFAGIVVVAVLDGEAAALTAELEALAGEGLRVVVERSDAPESAPAQRFVLDLLGDDHPGIVAEISAALAERDVSIEELSSDVRDAPMAGGTLFEARAVLLAPAGAGLDDLRAALESLGADLMVDVTLSPQ